MRKIPPHNFPFLFSIGGWVWVVGLFLLMTIRAEEAILHLKNGDRLTGTILSEDDKTIVLKTVVGSVTVPKEQLARRETVLAPAAPARTNAPTTGGLATNAPATNAAPVTAKAPAVTAKSTSPNSSTNAAAKPPEPSSFKKFLLRWKGEIQLGANLGFSTKNRQTYTGRLKGDYVEGPLHNIVEYDASYGRTEGILSDNRMDGSWKIEYDLSKRLLVYNSAGAGYDEIRRIDLKYDEGPGLGYKFVILTNFVFKGEFGANYQQQYYADHSGQSRYSLRLAEDSWWQINPKLRFDEKIEFFPELDEFGQYRVRAESNLSYLLAKHLSFTMSAINLFESKVPPTVSHNDLQVRALLGYKF